ncbi:MAG: hypothetical protein ABIR52_01815 [Casimicrobiaceae bacterium]
MAALALDAPRRRALGLFLRHLACGERVAQRATALQAALAPDAHALRFHRTQARHEALHARVFDVFARSLGVPPLAFPDDPYARYLRHVAEACGRGDYPETLIGTQVVLEALGDALLERLDAGLTRRGAGFGRLRRVIRAQETAHHAYGRARIARYAAQRELQPALREATRTYLALGDALIAAGASALEHFAVAPTVIAADVRARIPAWLMDSA